MEEGGLVADTVRIVYRHDRAAVERAHALADQFVRRDRDGVAARLPDMREMRLAAAARPRDDACSRGPLGPGLDEGQRRLIARARHEVLAREAALGLERKRELGRTRFERH